MKTLIIAFCLLLSSSTSFAETKKQKKTQAQVIALMKQKTPPRIDPKVEEALKKRFSNFDGRYVFPSFSHNVFWLNHLNQNFNICPKYTTEIFNGVRTIIIPGGTREVTKTIKVPVYGMVPIYETVPIYEYKDIFETRTRPTSNPIGYTDPIYGPGPNIIGYEKIKVTEYEPGPWGSWTTSSSAGDIIGNKTMEGWAIDRHADYLATLPENAGKNTKQLKDIARTNIENANWCKNGCKIQIIPKNGDVRFTTTCTSGNTVECGGSGVFITGSTPAPGKDTPGAEGEWKPNISLDETSRTRPIIPVEKEVNGDPIYETVKIEDGKPIYGEEEYQEKVGEEKVKVGEKDEKVGEKEEVVGEKEETVTEEEEYGPSEEEEEYQEERRARAKKEWKFSFAPAYFFDYDFGKLLLNQSEGGFRSIQSIKEDLGLPTKKLSRKISSEQQLAQKSYNQAIQQLNYTPANIVPNEDGPYLVKKFFTITAGLGVTASANYTNAGLLSQLGLSVALLPTLGGGAYSIMLFDTLEDAEKAKHLNIPRDPEEMIHWRNGDTLQYDVHGGIVFTGGAGWYGLAAGVSFVAQGIWQRTFSKINEKTVLAKLDKNKVFSFGLYGAAGLASLSVDKFISKENALTFAFDISTSKGKELLKDFMKGDMRKVQAVAANEKDRTVISGMKALGKTKGKSFSFGIGIPYLPASARWNKGDFLNESSIEFLGANRKRNSTMYAKVFSFKGRFFPLFKNTVDGYFSTVTLNTGVTPEFARVIKSGQYAFNFQRSYADKKDIEEVLDNLLKRTGLKGLLKIKIAENVDKVGSAEIKFAVKFKTSATEFLISQMKNQAVFDRIAIGFTDSYFKGLDNKKDDVFGLCEKGIFRRCKDRINKETAKALFKMKSSLLTMSKLDSNTKESREKLARAYTNFGDAMMSNPITFQTILAMVQGKGADVYLSVETSKTRKYEGIIKWSE